MSVGIGYDSHRFTDARPLKLAGVRIPGAAGGTYGADRLTIDDGLERLRRSTERLRSEPAKFHGPAFGPMTREEQIALNLRHAELHMGFFEPG